MATMKDKHFEKMFRTIVDHNDHHNVPLFNEKLQQVVSKFTEETQGEERNITSDANNVTMDTFCQSPVMHNTQRNIANVPNERRIYSDILAEMIKVFNRLTLRSTIKYSGYYNSDEDDAESDTNSDQLVATHTSDGKKRKFTDTDTNNGNSPQKFLINRTIPVIIPPIDPPIADGVAASRGTLHANHTIASKEIVTDAARSGARVSKILRW